MQRKNPRYSGDNTPQYRVNLLQIQIDLYKIGYSLNGYRMIMNFVDLAKIEKLEEKLNGEKHLRIPMVTRRLKMILPQLNLSQPRIKLNQARLTMILPRLKMIRHYQRLLHRLLQRVPQRF